MPFRSPDVAVIGAGIIGASIAWRLAQSGWRVGIFDAGRFGGEASWAGAGMLAPGGELDRHSPWSDFALESLRLYPGFVAELASESGCPIDYQEHGAVELAETAEEWERLQARAAAQRELAIASEPLDRAQLREMVPLLRRETAGALYFPRDAVVDPRDIMRALRMACERRHVRIHESRRVTAIQAGPRGVAIRTASEAVAAEFAVLAAGAWSGDIPVSVDGQPHPIASTFPVKGHLVGYRLASGSLRPILRHHETYLLQRAGGFTIAGTSVERVGFDRQIDPRIVTEIRERAEALLPCLRAAGAPEPWIGFRPATASLLPEIARVPGASLWLCYGHYRNGILLAPATAARVAAQLHLIASSGTDSTSPGASR